ncbi:hypothetical protein AB2D70_02320 [Escherichia coli]
MYWRTPFRAGKHAFRYMVRTAVTFFTPYARPVFSPDTVGRIDGAMSWGESLTKEA